MAMYKKIFYRIIVPILTYNILNILIDDEIKHLIPHYLSAFLPSIIEFANFAVYAGVASVFLEEVLHSTVMPAFCCEMREIRNALTLAIDGKEFVFNSVTESQEKMLLKIDEKAMEYSLRNNSIELSNTAKEKELIINARKSIQNVDYDNAIGLFEEIVKTNKHYYGELISALLASEKTYNLEKAKELLESYGEPYHYIGISFSYWQKRNIEMAISILEKGFDRFKDNELNNSASLMASYKNSLAYYYADEGLVENAQKAFTYAEEALQIRKDEDCNSREYANALDTLGLVKITFGTNEDIREGLDMCDDARRAGVEEYLYFCHVELAQSRLRLNLS